MSATGRFIGGNALLQSTGKKPFISMNGTWMGTVVQRRVNDDKWHEFRRAKAMSWPKTIIPTSAISDTCSSLVNNENEENDKNPRNVWEKPLSQRHITFGRSLGRLTEEDCNQNKLDDDSTRTECFADPASLEARNKFENHINCRPTNVIDSGILETRNRGKTFLMRQLGEELATKQPPVQSEENDAKSCGYRRARGGLRDLIRLHEEEIVRASGAQGYNKRAKHDDCRASASNSFDESQTGYSDDVLHSIPTLSTAHSQFDNRPCDVAVREQSMLVVDEEQFSKNVNTSVNENISDLINQSVEMDIVKLDEATSTTDSLENDQSSMINDKIKVEYEDKLLEKDTLIEILKAEKGELLSELEEQKKVANAYQKLEDRYRRKVFNLEKMMFSCTCGAVHSSHVSSQDTLKNPVRHDLQISHNEVQQPMTEKVDGIISELEHWLMDQKSLQMRHENGSNAPGFLASGKLSDVKLNSFPLEFIDQFDATSV